MTDLAAWLATHTRPPRDWPTPTEPDWEPAGDDGRDDWSDHALDHYTPEYGDMMTRGGW